MYRCKLTVEAYSEQLINDGDNANEILRRLGIVDEEINRLESQITELRQQDEAIVAAYKRDAVAKMPEFPPEDYR